MRPYYAFAPSKLAGEQMDAARDRMAAWLNVGADELHRARVREALGPFDTWQHCAHAPIDRCPCRAPAPGLVLWAAHEMGVAGHEMAVISNLRTGT